MSTFSAANRSSVHRSRRHRERRRNGTRCVTVVINQSERDALVVRGYLSEEDRDNGASIKKAIGAVARVDGGILAGWVTGNRAMVGS